MTKEMFENLQRQIEDHLAAIPREKTRFPDKNVSMLQYVEVELKSLLTQPADVQEMAKELAVDFAWENVLNHADGYQSFRKAFDTWFSGNKYHQDKHLAGASSLQAENERLKRLLHDLTPGGSEFYNDPEKCAKWIRESRDEAHYSMAVMIKKLKDENEQLKALNKQ